MIKQSKLLSVFLSVVLALLVLTTSIAVPILCRPFYYAQIGPLGLVEYTGLSEEQIRTAYDEMMDFCVGKSDEFSTGILPWSEEGKAHFVDVKRLFLLDLSVMAGCVILLTADFILRSRRKLRPYRFLGRGPSFWAAAGMGGAFAVIGTLAAVDFSRAFVIFHTLFFPGKTNWLFDWRTDAIILILPEVFFASCAVLIVGLLLVWCAALIGADVWIGRQMRPRCPGFSPELKQ